LQRPPCCTSPPQQHTYSQQYSTQFALLAWRG